MRGVAERNEGWAKEQIAPKELKGNTETLFSGMDEDDDWDWGLTAEQLDSLERDAFQRLAQHRSGVQPPSNSNSNSRFDQHIHTSISNPLPLPKFHVKFFLHATGNIAAKFSYDQVMNQ